MTKEQLFKAELCDLLKEYNVRIVVEVYDDYCGPGIRGVCFEKLFTNDVQEDINFFLFGRYFDYKDLEVK